MFPGNAVKEPWQWILATAVVILMVVMHMEQGIAAEAKPTISDHGSSGH